MSPDDPVVEVIGLSKRYARDMRRSLRYGIESIGRESLGRPARTGRLRESEFLSLDGVSFSLRKGEALAVVGANGAGKSTLLKILAGLVKPDTGRVTIRGRVGALIELGAGFDPVLTGRENIATQGLVIGLGRRQIAELTERVIEFSELEDAIDTPIRYYSSGMTARLAFAVTSQAEADVLLVDEVLAVGDLSFQRKCISHLLTYVEGGGALLLVSHNVYQVQTVCDRGVLLADGQVVFDGPAVEALGRHLELQRDAGRRNPGGIDHSGEVVRVIDLTVVARDGGPVRHGSPADLVITYEARETHEVIAVFSVWTADGLVCVTGTTSPPRTIAPGRGELRAHVERLPLMPGGFTLRAAVVDRATSLPLGMLGFQDTPRTLTIGTSPTVETNALETMRQLTGLDASWSP